MKLVHCLTHSSAGGGQQVVYMLMKHLRELSPESRLTVVLPAGGVFVRRFRDLDIEVEECGLDSLATPGARRLKEIIRSREPDIVHSHGKGAGYHARISAGRRERHVHSYHGYHPPQNFISRSIYNVLEQRLLRNTDAIINVSISERDEFVRDHPLAAGKSRVIPNIVDRGQILFDANQPLNKLIEPFIEFNRRGFIVTMIGRNDPVKNYPLALQSVQLAMRRNERMAAAIVGIEPAQPMFRRFQSEFPQRVLLLPVFENTSPLLKRSHVLLITSKKEGAPLVILEAQALGIPVVGTQAPGIADLSHHDRDALLCPPSPGQIASALISLAENHNLWSNLSAESLRIAGTWDMRAWADQYLTVYRDILVEGKG